MNTLLVLLLLCTINLVAQKKSNQSKNLPSGFEWVKKRGLVVSKNEITTEQWLEFLSTKDDSQLENLPQPNEINNKCVCEKTGDDVKIKYPETIVFRDTTYMEANDDRKKKKNRHVREYCNSLPITGITVEQALSFCHWLSEKYSADPKYIDLNLTFRLPTAPEYDSLLSDVINQWRPGEDGYTTYKNGINSHGCAMYNHTHDSWCNPNLNMKYGYGYRVPMQVGYFFADANGLFDIMGNVAEMTSEKGIAKGGSCKDKASACQPGAVNQYEEPQWWLGFRVVAELN
jgi:formylglycine-generating enzyme required for sulfatase activity